MAHIIACFANDSKGASLHYTSFRDDKRVNVRQGAISREVSARKKFAVNANVEGRVKIDDTPQAVVPKKPRIRDFIGYGKRFNPNIGTTAEIMKELREGEEP